MVAKIVHEFLGKREASSSAAFYGRTQDTDTARPWQVSPPYTQVEATLQ